MVLVVLLCALWLFRMHFFLKNISGGVLRAFLIPPLPSAIVFSTTPRSLRPAFASNCLRMRLRCSWSGIRVALGRGEEGGKRVTSVAKWGGGVWGAERAHILDCVKKNTG